MILYISSCKWHHKLLVVHMPRRAGDIDSIDRPSRGRMEKEFSSVLNLIGELGDLLSYRDCGPSEV